jgi:hypothetical protein
MTKIPYTEEQARKLVENGHLSEDTFHHIKASGGFMQGYDEGGVVMPDQPATLNPQSDLMNQKAAYYQSQNPGMSLGDAMARAGMEISQAKMNAAAQDAAPQAGFDTSMASLPKTPAEALANDGGAAPMQQPLQGVQVASIDPSADKQIAASIAPQSPEAGHVPTGSVVGGGAQAPQAGAMPLPGADYMKAMDEGLTKQYQGTEKLGKAQAGAAAESAKFMSGMANQMRREQSIDQIHEYERQDAAQQGLEKLNKLGAEIQSAKIDQNHFWSSRTTGQKISAAIGIALGGIGQGLMKSNSNAAMDIITHAIDRDIDAQKANLANKRAGFEAQTGLYGMVQKNFQDERQARLAARSLGLQAAEMQLKSIAAKAQSPEIAAQYQALLGQMQATQAQTRQQMAFQGYQMRALGQAMGPGGGSVNPEALPKEYKERYVPGLGFTRDPETRRKVDEFRAGDDAFQKDIAALKDFAIKNRGATLDRDTVNKGKAMAAAVQNSYRKAEGMGVYKESESEFMKNLVGSDPTTWTTYVPQLEALGESAKNARDSFYSAHISGYQPIKEGAARGR